MINQEGEEKRINHWVNKKWKLGGDFHAPIENRLKFLYEIGRKEQVGMYLKNQNIRDGHSMSNTKRGQSVKKHMDTLKEK